MANNCDVKQKPKTIKEFIRSRYLWKQVLALVIGATAGFLYYQFVGCASGSCPISGNPYISTIMGGLMGLFMVNSPCRSGKCQ